MTPLEKIMASSAPNVVTGCRVWEGKTDADGEPVILARGNWVPVKRYLTSKKLKRKGFYPVFENKCGNPECVTATHLRVASWVSR